MTTASTSSGPGLDERFGRDHTRRFAGITAAVAKLAARALVLDGEAVVSVAAVGLMTTYRP